MLNRIMNDESGVLTFEWILLITLLVIGIVGGIAVMRDSIVIEAAETANAVMALNQSYTIEAPLGAVISATVAADNTVLVAEVASSTGAGSIYTDQSGVVSVNAGAQPSN